MIAESLNAFFGGFAALSLDGMNPRDPAIVRMLGMGRQVRSGVRLTAIPSWAIRQSSAA